jgi:hypothetical protein
VTSVTPPLRSLGVTGRRCSAIGGRAQPPLIGGPNLVRRLKALLGPKLFGRAA